MELIFIGTGSGVTSLKRFHSSILIKSGDNNLLLDAGDGVSKGLLKSGINFNDINSVIFSHYHPDHFSGISSLITQMILSERRIPLYVYTHKYLIAGLKTHLNTCYIFDEKLNFELELVPFKFGGKNIISDTIEFTAKQNSHIRNKAGIKYIPEERFCSSSFLLTADSNKILFTADVGDEDDLYLFEDEQTDILISETSHLEPDSILNAAVKLNISEVYLTHIDDKNENRIVEFINKNKSLCNLNLAHDGLTIIKNK